MGYACGVGAGRDKGCYLLGFNVTFYSCLSVTLSRSRLYLIAKVKDTETDVKEISVTNLQPCHSYICLYLPHMKRVY